MRAATFGAMDGLVSNTALIAGVGAAASAHTVLLSGVAGLLAGAFSMAMGEYTSVTTANEQIDSEVLVERARVPQASAGREERAGGDADGYGDGAATPLITATDEIHRDENRALNFHLVQELGIDPSEKPSPWVAAGSSFAMFTIGAIIPLIPYLLGFESLWAGLLCGGIGLIVAGGVAARFTRRPSLVCVVAAAGIRHDRHRGDLRLSGHSSVQSPGEETAVRPDRRRFVPCRLQLRTHVIDGLGLPRADQLPDQHRVR